MKMSGSIRSSTFYLDRVGDVVLSLNPDRLSWIPVHRESKASSCLGMNLHSKAEVEIKFSNIYAIELIDRKSTNRAGFRFRSNPDMYRFVVHGFHKIRYSPWVLSAYTFGHEDLLTCQTWAEQVNAYTAMEVGRPKNLLVFVHPLCGKGKGCETWDSVAPIFSKARVKTKVTITQRAGHAFDMITSYSNRELSSFDGIVSVGGDGLFNEVLNGLLSSRHRDSSPPFPPDFISTRHNDETQQSRDNDCSDSRLSFSDQKDKFSETSNRRDDHEPLLSASKSDGLGISNFTTNHEPRSEDTDSDFTFPNEWFRLGIIPAGSTDSVVISTTGVRDAVTSALHIVLGKKISLDIAQVVRWKTNPSSKDLPSVHYAASFAGYGFYGDVIKESEKYRWMGPKRYDYAGTKVFLAHRSYEAKIAYIESKAVNPDTRIDALECGDLPQPCQEIPKRLICRMNCAICNGTVDFSRGSENGSVATSNAHDKESRWLQSKGHFLSVGAAVISCRNEKAPDGLVADAHLSDGLLHLILIRDCPRPFYLWHLIQLTRRGSSPLDFEFAEHHKTSAFAFVASHDESVWNLDGELLQACQLSAQVCRGLINMFASGPEV